MSFLTSAAVAQAAAPAAGAPASPFPMLIMMVVLFGIFYFLMIRPQMKRQKEHRALLSALSKGDEVITNGGIAGRIEDVNETFVSVEISPGVVVKLQKGAVSQILPKGTLKSS
jgi:preprotein translocase subunit YajC